MVYYTTIQHLNMSVSKLCLIPLDTEASQFLFLLKIVEAQIQSVNSDLPQIYSDRRKHVEGICEQHHERLVQASFLHEQIK